MFPFSTVPEQGFLTVCQVYKEIWVFFLKVEVVSSFHGLTGGPAGGRGLLINIWPN
jgi:hypothetical protein